MLNAIFLFVFSMLFILGVVLLFWINDKLPAKSTRKYSLEIPEPAMQHPIMEKDKGLPYETGSFETKNPGIYVAGELGGAVSIKEATEGAVFIVNKLALSMRDAHSADFDLIIVGAGPAGLSAALTARMNNLKFIVLEQYSVAQAFADHPNDKVTGSVSLDLPLAGNLSLKNYSRKQLMEMWQKLILRFKIPVQENCRVLIITAAKEYFKVLASENQKFTTKFILLTTGKRKVNQWIPVFKNLQSTGVSEAGKIRMYADELI